GGVCDAVGRLWLPYWYSARQFAHAAAVVWPHAAAVASSGAVVGYWRTAAKGHPHLSGGQLLGQWMVVLLPGGFCAQDAAAYLDFVDNGRCWSGLAGTAAEVGRALADAGGAADSVAGLL